MHMVRVKMSHYRRGLRQLPREPSQRLLEQDEGEKCGNVMFHTKAKITKADLNAT